MTTPAPTPYTPPERILPTEPGWWFAQSVALAAGQALADAARELIAEVGEVPGVYDLIVALAAFEAGGAR